MAITTKKPLRRGMHIRRGVQDRRDDVDTIHWFASGLTNNATQLEVALNQVISEVGGDAAPSPCYANQATAPKLHSGTARFFSASKAMGTLTFLRGNLDCLGDRIRSSIGFVETRGAEGGAIESVSSGGPCDVSGISLPNLQRRRVAVEHIGIRCIANDTRPQPDTDMLGTINDAQVTLLGVDYPAYTLRYDGISVSHQAAKAGDRYPHWINFTYLEGGWISHKLLCVRYEAVDIGGTLPSYVLQFEDQQRYQYPDSTFKTLATLCPVCDG